MRVSFGDFPGRIRRSRCIFLHLVLAKNIYSIHLPSRCHLGKHIEWLGPIVSKDCFQTFTICLVTVVQTYSFKIIILIIFE